MCPSCALGLLQWILAIPMAFFGLFGGGVVYGGSVRET